jgi:anaerobic glycerol-3-phosphate dehydrogenase
MASTTGHAPHSLYVAQPMKDPQTEVPLPSLDQLRNNAAECIRLAQAARTSAHKSFFIEMADRWLTLAERAKKIQDG